MDKPVVFDFDKTLTHRDTVWGFFSFASKGIRFRTLKAGIYFLKIVLSKLQFGSIDEAKAFGIRSFIMHLKKDELETIAEAYSKTIKLNRVFEKQFKSATDPWVASASFSIYLSPIFGDERLVAAELEFDKNEFPTGRFRSCGGIEKAQRMKALGYDSIAEVYTDSRADLPLARLADAVYLVQGENVVRLDSCEQL